MQKELSVDDNSSIDEGYCLGIEDGTWGQILVCLVVNEIAAERY